MKIKVIQTICPNFTIGKVYECNYFSGGSALVKDDFDSDSVLWHNEYIVLSTPEEVKEACNATTAKTTFKKPISSAKL